jgi:RimJ/RimL family protein N-acetyltransferase
MITLTSILRTRYLMDERGRMSCTLEPEPLPAPFFTLMRSASDRAWAVRADVPGATADQLDRMAREEQPMECSPEPPLHAGEYLSLLKGQVRTGPTFLFPNRIPHADGTVVVDRLDLLERNFHGWTADEIPTRSPIMAVIEGGYPVSICFCSRKTDSVAEAGVETVEAFRGRGLAPLVTAAWAAAIRSSGRTPVYSTFWENHASRAVARKLGLIHHASDWSIVEESGT